MDNRTVAATVVGGIIGAMAGYLLFTDGGRAFRRQLEPALEDFARELNNLRNTINKAAGVAGEGWRMLNDALGERELHSPRYPTPHQSSPF
jgi:hypothetical protein